jgi:hypothetical protein
MAGHYIKGASITHRPAAVGGGAWRGLSMYFATDATFAAAFMIVPWDTVLAETDGIRSTGTETPGVFSVPAGQAGVVPAGMAGLWRLAGQLYFDTDPTSDPDFIFTLIVNDLTPIIRSILGPSPGVVVPRQFSLSVGPIVLELAEGDVVWALAEAPTGGTVKIGGFAGELFSTFLMEYLG